MVSLGMWACQWRELRPITFGGSNTAGAAQTKDGHDEDTGGDPTGQARGRGRGRNRDGMGAYEMIGMKEDAGEAV